MRLSDAPPYHRAVSRPKYHDRRQVIQDWSHPWGLEVHILRNGKLRMSRRFAKSSQPVAWATEERTALEQGLP